jgi:carbon-monoxide dehydrogenase medium subunit
MIPAAFQYHRATSLSDAAKVLAKHQPGAKLLAGGHSLIPAMKLRLATPELLVDIGGLADLRVIKRSKKQLSIGALATHAQIAASPDVQGAFRGLAEAAAAIGDVQVRNRGTIGGSLAHADVAADYPAAVLAFEAEITVKSAKGARTIPAFKFFKGLFATDLTPEEIVTEVRVPDPRGAGSAYVKFEQPASGFAVVGVCAVVELDKRGNCKQARFAATGVSDRPVRLSTLETALKGHPWSAEAVRAACERADADVRDMRDDLYASAEYRRHLLRVIARRAAERAVGSTT